LGTYFPYSNDAIAIVVGTISLT